METINPAVRIVKARLPLKDLGCLEVEQPVLRLGGLFLFFQWFRGLSFSIVACQILLGIVVRSG